MGSYSCIFPAALYIYIYTYILQITDDIAHDRIMYNIVVNNLTHLTIRTSFFFNHLYLTALRGDFRWLLARSSQDIQHFFFFFGGGGGVGSQSLTKKSILKPSIHGMTGWVFLKVKFRWPPRIPKSSWVWKTPEAKELISDWWNLMIEASRKRCSTDLFLQLIAVGL